MSSFRRKLFFNNHSSEHEFAPVDTRAYSFHKSLPNYNPTPLISLPDLASELNINKVYIKDESSRFSLPSFKILGASWGSCQAIIRELGLPENSDLAQLKANLAKNPLRLLAATDGNHGRAVAHIAKLLGISASIVVPSSLEAHVKTAISNEGGNVIEVEGSYDNAVRCAAQMAEPGKSLLIQDTSWEGYEDIPAWIVDGYSTIFHEILEQQPDLLSTNCIAITPVGVGSLAHAVVRSCKTLQPEMKVVSVEPDTAACLYKNRGGSELTPIDTSFTIMTGMDCGTVSRTAYQDLQNHVDVSLTISDFEAHCAVQYLEKHGVVSGPCGASGIAAAGLLAASGVLTPSSTVLLINTESSREYPTPFDVSPDDPVELTQILTQIESTSTTSSRSPSFGEQKIADYIEAWLQHRDIETSRVGTTSRPSIVGRVGGNGNGKLLVLNGDIDTVSLEGYHTDPPSGSQSVKNDREVISGRGAPEMKAGVAVEMCNLARAKKGQR